MTISLTDTFWIPGQILGGIADVLQGVITATVGLATLDRSAFSAGTGLITRGVGDTAVGIARTVPYVWNSPNTALGLGVGAVGYAAGAVGHALGLGPMPSIRTGYNAIEFLNDPLVELLSATRGNAVTIGNTAAYAPGHKPNTYEWSDIFQVNVHNGYHEQGHTFQGQRWGPLFIPVYLFSLVLRSDPFERAADEYSIDQAGYK